MVLISTIFLGIIKLQMRIDGIIEKGLFVRTKKVYYSTLSRDIFTATTIYKMNKQQLLKEIFKNARPKSKLGLQKAIEFDIIK